MLTELEKKNLQRNITEMQNILNDVSSNSLTAHSLMNTAKLLNERSWEFTLLAGKLHSRESM